MYSSILITCTKIDRDTNNICIIVAPDWISMYITISERPALADVLYIDPEQSGDEV